MHNSITAGRQVGVGSRASDTVRVAEACNYLLLSPAYDKLAAEVVAIVDNWDHTPRIYSGKQAVLNALVDAGVDNRRALDRILAIVAERRALLPRARKADYQRSLMQQRRGREYRARHIHELTEGLLKGEAREVFCKEVRRRWALGKAEHLAATAARLGRELTYEERLDATAQFWEGVDRNLTEALTRRGRK